ncbi:MAG: primosomal protein N' (replication factor Y) [Oceanicoccus sp.]|jgi:primosomal protein N' (replication factor Y)
MTAPFYLSVAIPAPLNRSFDYLPEVGCDMSQYQTGLRVNVPFGPRTMVGVIVDIRSQPQSEGHKLKAIQNRIDHTPLLSKDIYDIGLWLNQYYHQPIGECLHTVMPVLLRKGQAANPSCEAVYHIIENPNTDTIAALKRAPRQQALYEHLQQHGETWHKDLTAAGFTSAIINAVTDKGLINEIQKPSFDAINGQATHAHLALNEEQQIAVSTIAAQQNFQPYLLDGVTGSGKTEVYLQSIAPHIKAGKQVLILVPEIGLTPQMIQRFAQRFDADILLLHSALTDRERLDAWIMAAQHQLNERPQIIIGTRSAVFTPAPNLAMIIIDEEHDASFKQQDGIRYHGRDVAVMRAKLLDIPIVLGSATPSLDSLQNALGNKYQHLVLRERAGNAHDARLHIFNMKKRAVNHGLADELLTEIQSTLDKQQQVLVFINRRGFAPTLYCPDCGWIAECKRCDAKMTLHQKPPHLHCHHCDHKSALPRQCPECLSNQIHPMGVGTERLESHLTAQFNQTPVIRIDRDSTQKKDSMETLLEPVHAGEPCILIGTQMLAKGHHFPKVTLVIMVNIDSGFFSADFRAMEKTAQLVLQVSGRAGREKDLGRAYLQTEFADHPLLHLLTEENYHALSLALLEERKQQHLPPYGFQALVRADSPNPKEAEQFLYRVREIFNWHQKNNQLAGISFLGPLPSPMELRAGRFRSQLWINSPNRKLLHHFIKLVLNGVYEVKGFNRVRWSLDVDPTDNL